MLSSGDRVDFTDNAREALFPAVMIVRSRIRERRSEVTIPRSASGNPASGPLALSALGGACGDSLRVCGSGWKCRSHEPSARHFAILDFGRDLVIAGLVILLAFMFYQAEHRHALPTAPAEPQRQNTMTERCGFSDC